MESEIPSGGIVNSFDELNSGGETLPPEVFPADIPVELLDITRRFNRYIEGTFANGKLYERMCDARRKFKKATGYSWEHIDRMSRVFMRWSTDYKFSRERHGRSTYIYIRPKRRPLVLSTGEVRRRLVGAIVKHVANRGQAHIDRKFLENFHALYGLPPEQITDAWRTIKYIDGHRVRWKGCGRGQNLYVEPEKNEQVSPRQKRRGISPPTGGKEMKTAALPQSPKPQTETARGVAPPDPLTEMPENTTHRPGSPNGGDDKKPSGWPEREPTEPKPPQNGGAFHRWKPMGKPLHVGDRWVSAARLARKAFWLACNPLYSATLEFFRVRWSKGYAVKFARQAIDAGFLDSEICAAWRAGLHESHTASLARDGSPQLRGLPDGSQVWQAPQRELSQTVNVAWRILRADERSDEQRWAAIFAGDAKPAGAALVPAATSTSAGNGAERSSGAEPARAVAGAATRAEKSAARSASAPRGEFRGVAGMRVRLPPEEAPRKKKMRPVGIDGFEVPANFPDTTPAARRAMGEGATFEQFLKSRGLALVDLLKLPRAAQQKFVREMHAWQKSQGTPPPGIFEKEAP